MKHLFFTLLCLMGFQLSYAQCPTPEIIGDFYGCGGDLLEISVDSFFADHDYVWVVSGEATVLAPIDGEVSIQLPDTTHGVFTLVLTETDASGCSQNAQVQLHIEEVTSLTCNDLVNLSLNDECTLEITADMILEAQPYPNESFSITVRDMSGQELPHMLQGSDYIHQTVEVTVDHDCSLNSCWGYITLEDKMGPIIDCPDNVTISCFADAVTFSPPLAYDNCDLSVSAREIYNKLEMEECNSNYAGVRTLQYISEDDWGNESEVCTYYIYYEFEDISDVIFPNSKDDVEDDVLTCENDPVWDLNGNGYPDVEETGRPILNGHEIFATNNVCKINATYTDTRIDICDESFKVLREWIVLDWCTGEIESDIQILKVLDQYGPVVTCSVGALDTVLVRPYECLADYKVTPPTIIFECSDSTYFEVYYLLANSNGEPPVDGEYIQDNVELVNGEYIIRDLPLGRTWIKFEVFDGCGNSTECFTEVDVEDQIAPIPVCDQNTVVGLTTVDFAQVFATTFDDGSYDNCGEIYYEVARMNSGCGIGTAFDESTIFCCDDIGEELMVQLRVTDGSGNSNTCMVNVTVQDKAEPIITCPDDLVISCEDPHDIDLTGGMATAVDNCPGVEVELLNESVNIDQCHTGRITRTYKATDKSDQMSTCTHTILIEDFTPFEYDDINWNTVKDVELTGCSDLDTHPDETGWPTWSNDECSLVASEYDDEVFHYVDSVCLKILRTWTVIDWCTFDDNTGYGLYTYVQVIKLHNTVAPEFESCQDITVCAYEEDCTGDIELFTPATDDCTPEDQLKFLYIIDIDNNGTNDRPGAEFDLSGNYPLGKHKIDVEVSDGCGNRTDCEFILTVEDCKEPTPYCLTEISTVVMPSSEMVEIWASDFDHGSFDNCPGDLIFSFSSNKFDQNKTFTCDDLGVNEIEMWVTDAAGNQDFCSVQIDIQPGTEACEGTNRVSGRITSTLDDNMSGVEVSLSSIDNNESVSSMTNDQGEFEMYGVDPLKSYVISGLKNDDHLNGVSTLDLVFIQRHILDIARFESSDKLIAADVNNNGKVSSSDLVALRKLILGINNKFDDNTSWKFVDRSVIPENENAPWPLTEQILVKGSEINNKVYNFKGIKIGDVDFSAVTNVNSEKSTPRSANPLQLVVDNQDYEPGEILKIEFYAAEEYFLYGLQKSINLNPSLEFLGIEAGALDMNESHIGLTKVFEGDIATSWTNVEGLEVEPDEVLFTLFVKAKGYGNIKNALSLNNTMLNTEVYNESFNREDIKLEVRRSTTEGIFNVAQNAPNPFSGVSSIEVELGQDADVELSVYDVSGRVIYSKIEEMTKGYNTLIIDSDQLGVTGVLTYSVKSKFGQVVRKMVVVK